MLKKMTLISSVIAGFALLLGGVQAKTYDGKLRFFLQPSTRVIPHIVEWQQLTKDFAASDPEIASVQLVTNYADLEHARSEVDCAYTFNNYVPFIDLSWIQPLDTFLEADAALDRSDVPDHVWSLVTRDEQVYGLPLTLMPMMMWYKPEAFEAAGVSVPHNGWSADDFLATVKALKEHTSGIVYDSYAVDGQFYLMLASAFGTPVVDYSTHVPTYHLTDPAVVETLRQLLDLSAQGVRSYKQLDITNRGEYMTWQYDEDAILYDSWGAMLNTDETVMPVTFPQGADSAPTAYYLGAGYIMADTSYGEACYRWLSTLAQHPELFDEMPAYRSQVTNEALIALQGQAISDTYTAIFEQLDSPQEDFVAAGLASTNAFPGSYAMHVWYAQAMDDAGLHGVDLEASLADAQGKIEAYVACISELPSIEDVGEDEALQAAYREPIKSCMLSVDPEMTYMFQQSEE